MKLTCHMGYFELHFTFQSRKINVKGKELLQNEYQGLITLGTSFWSLLSNSSV